MQACIRCVPAPSTCTRHARVDGPRRPDDRSRVLRPCPSGLPPILHAAHDGHAVCARPCVCAGEAHWLALLRARAIENQAYVIAAAQAGRHNAKRESYGHAVIIDPWGRVAGELDDPLATGIATADIDLAVRRAAGAQACKLDLSNACVVRAGCGTLSAERTDACSDGLYELHACMAQ